MRRAGLLVALVSMMCLLLAGCGESQPESAQDGTTEEAAQADDAAAADGIGLEQAKGIALEHAGVAEEEAVFTETGQETEDGKDVYKIDFSSGATEYEYEILVEDGTVLKYSSGIRENAGTSSGTTDNSSSQDNKNDNILTEKKAKEIAFQQAGVAEDEAEYVKVELDFENGVQVYEISFDSGSYEYEYEIGAESGEVLHYEKDRRD